MSPSNTLDVSSEALWRYRIVSTIEAIQLTGRRRTEAVRLVANGIHIDPFRGSREVSERTLYRWLAAFRNDGIAGLEPIKRQPLEGSRVLSDELLDYLTSEHKQDPDASIPELLRRAEKKHLITSDETIDRTTVWRTFQRLGIDTSRRVLPHDGDMRRFGFLTRMRMTLVDFVHFRAGITRVKRTAIYLLDDATRFGLDVAVAPSENTLTFLRCLCAVLRAFGYMDVIFSDRGPAFKADDSALVCARLKIPLILGTARYPEGRGKIERFNRSLRQRLLRSFDRAPDLDPDCGALELRLRHDLHRVYNHLPHESLDKQTPQQRWDACPRALRPIESEQQLTHAFTLSETRLASRDHVISFEGTAYEVPRGFGGRRVKIYRRPLENNALYVKRDDEWVELHPVDFYQNAISPRGQSPAEETVERTPRKTASTMDFDDTYAPITSADGGFSDNPDRQEDE